MIILDTNVLTDARKPQTADIITAWMDKYEPDELVMTVISVAEMRMGAESVRDPIYRRNLHARIEETMAMISTVLPLDQDAAELAGYLSGQRSRRGRLRGQNDAYIAAICKTRGATLATRNIKDFVDCGIDLVNPWDDSV